MVNASGVKKIKKKHIVVNKVDSEDNLVFALKMVRSEIKDGKFNASRRRVLLNYLETVDFNAITMM